MMYTNLLEVEGDLAAVSSIRMAAGRAQRLEFESLAPTPKGLPLSQAVAWRTENWGAPWGAIASDPPLIGDGSAQVHFKTLGAPAAPLVRGLSARFPEATVRLTVALADGNVEQLTFRDGQLI